MISKGPAVSPAIASAVISLLVGGVAGYYTHYFQSHDAPGTAPAGMGGGRPGGGMGGGGGGGMGGGQQPPASATLTRLVRNLNTVEQVQNQGLSANQKQSLLPVLTRIKGADKLSDKECEEYAATINKVLSEPQKQALQSLQPARAFGGGMGGGGMAGGMSGGYGRPAGGGMPAAGGRGGMGGGQSDPERPFAGERERTALDGLMAHLQAAPGAR